MAQTSKYHQWWVGGKEGLWPSSHPEARAAEARAAELDKAWAAGLQVAPSGRQELTIVAKLGHVTRRKGPGTLAPATGAPRSHLRRGRASPRDRRSLGAASSAPTAGATRPWPLGKRPAARSPSRLAQVSSAPEVPVTRGIDAHLCLPSEFSVASFTERPVPHGSSDPPPPVRCCRAPSSCADAPTLGRPHWRRGPHGAERGYRGHQAGP